MTDTTTGTPPQLKTDVILALEATLRGALSRPEDPDYDKVRRVWNGMIDRRPALIVRCRSAADVIQAVNFARSHGLLASVRGGGHNVAGSAVSEGGLMIDLSLMTSVRVDRSTQTVRAEPGTLLADLDRESQAFGLAVPAGTVSETGIAGLTLGGGMGWLTRQLGLTCDNLIGVDMVTSQGEFMHVNDETNPDLMWGIRGGGGNFGVVTSFKYQAARVGPTVLAGFVLHPIDQAEEFLEFYGTYAAAAPDELTTIAVVRIMPPVPSVPEELHGVRVAGTGVCYVGDLDEGERILKPLRTFGKPLSDSIGPTPFVDFQTVLDEGVPAGLRYYEKSHFLGPLTPELIDTLAEHGRTVLSPYAFVGLFQLGGAVSRVGEDDTAYTNRDAAYSLAISAGWDNPEDTDDNVRWVRRFWRAVEPHSAGGAYVNFMSDDEGRESINDGYRLDKHERLARLKTVYDPTNMFRFNSVSI